MKDISEEQKRASRENGALSRGPVTEEGKRISSKNARKHGLFARAVVLENERQSNFTILKRRFTKSFRPQTALEFDLVGSLTVAYWHMRRAWAIENRLMNQKLSNPDTQKLDWLTPAPISFPEPPLPAIDLDSATDEEYVIEMDRISAAWSDLSTRPDFSRLLQHEGVLHGKSQRIIGTLLRIREDRRAEKKSKYQNKPGKPKNQPSNKTMEINTVKEIEGEEKE